METGREKLYSRKKKPPKEILKKLLEIRSKRKKPFFDDKTQLDLNALWISALVAANEFA